MVLRISTILCIALLMAGAFGLYRVKYTVQDLRSEVTQLERELQQEHETLHVMRAEWAYLNRPQRLRRLAAQYLQMSPINGTQLAEISDVPYDNGEGENEKEYNVAQQEKTASYLIPVKNSR